MNSRILETVEEYERYSPLYDDEAEYYFRTMFENPETAVVFCDLMGMPSYMDEISVQDYIDLVKQQSQNTVVAIKDVSKGEYTFRDGKWYVPVAFRKSISYSRRKDQSNPRWQKGGRGNIQKRLAHTGR